SLPRASSRRLRRSLTGRTNPILSPTRPLWKSLPRTMAFKLLVAPWQSTARCSVSWLQVSERSSFSYILHPSLRANAVCSKRNNQSKRRRNGQKPLERAFTPGGARSSCYIHWAFALAEEAATILGGKVFDQEARFGPC